MVVVMEEVGMMEEGEEEEEEEGVVVVVDRTAVESFDETEASRIRWLRGNVGVCFCCRAVVFSSWGIVVCSTVPLQGRPGASRGSSQGTLCCDL